MIISLIKPKHFVTFMELCQLVPLADSKPVLTRLSLKKQGSILMRLHPELNLFCLKRVKRGINFIANASSMKPVELVLLRE